VRRIDAVVANRRDVTQQKKRGKPTEALEQHPDWERKRRNFLMEMQMEKLWSPSVFEENFVK